MERILRLGGGMTGMGQGGSPPADAPVVDTAEQVYISSLALLKMLKHGRAGVPMEVRVDLPLARAIPIRSLAFFTRPRVIL